LRRNKLSKLNFKTAVEKKKLAGIMHELLLGQVLFDQLDNDASDLVRYRGKNNHTLSILGMPCPEKCS